MSKRKFLVIFVCLLILFSTFGQTMAVNGKITTRGEVVENETMVLNENRSSTTWSNINQEPLQLATKIEGKPVYDAKIEPKKPTFKIKLKSGKFTPQPGMQPELKAMASEALAKMPTGKAPFPEYVYVLMQFNDDTLSETDFEAMQNDGVTFLSYLPENTYIVKMPISKAQDISYPSVRWMGILKPEQKISPELKEALSGSGKLIRDEV